MNNKFYVLREFAENISVNKEKFCFTYNISYDEFDDYIDQLSNVDKFLIPIENNYKVSIEGINYLKEHKVDVAVILASGLGTRMGDLTKDNSKCLLNVHGEVLLERLITQFQDRGIDNIIVVVGHVKEKFSYLKDKYNVRLIENPEYNTKNTIATFHCIIDEVKNKNTYITVGDIYLSENLFHTYEIEPFYTGVWCDDCTNEWTYIYDDKSKIYGVNVDGYFDYCMAGFSFHTKEFINKLTQYVNDDYNKKGTEKYYWEEVLLNNLERLPDLYVHKYPSVVLQEFDTINDLNRLNDELVDLKTQIKKIFNTDDDNIIFNKTNDGLTNNTYILEINDKKYIVRSPGISTSLLIDRKNEKTNYDKLKIYDITDKIVYFNENTGLKISEYFENSNVIDVNNKNDLLNSMAIYKKLHSLDIDTKHDVNISNVLNFYLSIIHKHKIKFHYCDLNSVLEKCHQIINYINSLNRPNTFTHGDAGFCNVLKTNNGYKLIDFEFAGMADPITDIALFGFCSNMNIEDTINLLDIYIDSHVDNIDNEEFLKRININNNISDIKALVVSYMAIDSIACALWNLIRITITNKHSYDYGKECIKSFNLCCDFLVNNNIIK